MTYVVDEQALVGISTGCGCGPCEPRGLPEAPEVWRRSSARPAEALHLGYGNS